MAEIIRFVDPDALGTGSGLDWTNAYTSLQAFETAEQTDLVAAGDWMHCFCRSSSGTANTTTLTFDGWTTNRTTNYILLEAADGDQALKDGWDDTRFRMIVNDANRMIRIRRSIDLRFKGLQLRNTGAGHAIECSNDSGTPSMLLIDCRVEKPNGGSGLTSFAGFLNTENTIVSGSFAGSGNGVWWTSTSSGGTSYNCISTGFGDGHESDTASSVIAKNGASFSNTQDFDSLTTVDYCLSDDGTGTNSQTPSGGDIDNEFVDSTNGDFTAVETGNIQNGVGPSADANVPTLDIEGDTRSGATAFIGVDEPAAVGGISIPVVMSHLRNQGAA